MVVALFFTKSVVLILVFNSFLSILCIIPSSAARLVKSQCYCCLFILVMAPRKGLERLLSKVTALLYVCIKIESEHFHSYLTLCGVLLVLSYYNYRDTFYRKSCLWINSYCIDCERSYSSLALFVLDVKLNLQVPRG